MHIVEMESLEEFVSISVTMEAFTVAIVLRLIRVDTLDIGQLI
jgi:hypothetical protein